MPFRSAKQRRFMFRNLPGIARRWVGEAKRKHQKPTQPKKKGGA